MELSVSVYGVLDDASLICSNFRLNLWRDEASSSALTASKSNSESAASASSSAFAAWASSSPRSKFTCPDIVLLKATRCSKGVHHGSSLTHHVPTVQNGCDTSDTHQKMATASKPDAPDTLGSPVLSTVAYTDTDGFSAVRPVKYPHGVVCSISEAHITSLNSLGSISSGGS